MQPEDVAMLASIAGYPAEQWHARAAILKWAGTPKGVALMKALGKVSMTATMGALSGAATANTISGLKPLVYFIRCILLLNSRKRESFYAI